MLRCGFYLIFYFLSKTGAATAIEFARSGAKLAITGRDSEALQKVATEIEKVSGTKPLQIVGDLEDQQFTKSLIEQVVAFYGKLDILVNKFVIFLNTIIIYFKIFLKGEQRRKMVKKWNFREPSTLGRF